MSQRKPNLMFTMQRAACQAAVPALIARVRFCASLTPLITSHLDVGMVSSALARNDPTWLAKSGPAPPASGLPHLLPDKRGSCPCANICASTVRREWPIAHFTIQ